MLYNLKLLGFKAPRAYQCEFGETVREVQEVHEALLRFKTKFHAAFARSVPKIVLILLYTIFRTMAKTENLLNYLEISLPRRTILLTNVYEKQKKGNKKGKKGK